VRVAAWEAWMVVAPWVAVRAVRAWLEQAWTAVEGMLVEVTAEAERAGLMALALRVVKMVVARLEVAALVAAEGVAVAEPAGRCWVCLEEPKEEAVRVVVVTVEMMVWASKVAPMVEEATVQTAHMAE
jgi:hypothetical protein